SFQASLVALAELGLPPLEVIVPLNRVLSRRFPESSFVTLFYGVLDPGLHTMDYINAGHCPPMLISGDGPPRRLAQTGRPLALFAESPYAAATTPFRPGDTLIAFTDGIPGARSPGGEWYGEDPILRLGREAAADEPASVVGRILSDVESFLGGKSREDDFTALILRRNR